MWWRMSVANEVGGEVLLEIFVIMDWPVNDYQSGIDGIEESHLRFGGDGYLVTGRMFGGGGGGLSLRELILLPVAFAADRERM
mmetsp:Transcript_17804/g.21284  ORF Transcript_17804/g.21284 Transcript_17804/m.21284 type:complete len:83 (+) Transcript_17804:363-611(+)